MNDKDDKDIIIKINYENQKLLIYTSNEVKLEEIIKKCVKVFNIDKEFITNLFFTFINDNGNINRIDTTEEILKNAKEIKPGTYLTEIDLKVSENEKFNQNFEKNSDNNRNEKENRIIYYEKKLEKIHFEKNKKIKELEEKIEKMKKEHSEELNKILTENDSTDSRSIEVPNEKPVNDKELLNIKDNNIFSSEIQKIKDEIISEVKKGLKKNQKSISNNTNLNYIKDNIYKLNNNLNKNIKNLDLIQNDLSKANKAINTIIKKREENKKNEETIINNENN